MGLSLKKAALPTLSWQQYEELEQKSSTRHEFMDGMIYAMGGATDNHNRIAGNIFSGLHQALKGKKCEAFIQDMKVRIRIGTQELGYYPDIMVICDENDNASLYRKSPSIIIEVLSRSTMRIDRREKFLAYQAIPSLLVYMLVDQNQMRVILYRRETAWKAESFQDETEIVNLPEIQASLSIAEIYARVDWNSIEKNEESDW